MSVTSAAAKPLKPAKKGAPVVADSATHEITVTLRNNGRLPTALDMAKQQLITLAQHNSESGGGVSVSRYWKTGAVEYKKIPALAGIELEQYRGAGREEVRVTVLK